MRQSEINVLRARAKVKELKAQLRKKEREHVPTKKTIETVENCTLAGFPAEKIAPILGIGIPTLWKHYKEILENAQKDAIGKVAKTLFQQAYAGNIAACIFILKCRAHWRENPALDDSIALVVKRVVGVPDDAV